MEQNLYGQWLKISVNRRQIKGDKSDLVNKGTRRSSRRKVLDSREEGASKMKGSTATAAPKDVIVTSSAQLRTRSFTETDVRTRKVRFKEGPHEVINGPNYGRTEGEEGVVKDGGGFEVLEYVVEKQDKSLGPVLRFPTVVIVGIVILWSFSIMSTGHGVTSVGVVMVWTYVTVWNTVIEETLLVTSTLGVQVIQTNILGKMKYAKYVPIDNIKAVVINEIIRRQRVISYLLVVLKSSESTGRIVVPLLNSMLPRLRTIEKIYHHIQRAIFKNFA